MRISVEWLKDYVDVPEDLGRLRQDLTMAGLVVEGVLDVNGAAVLELEITSNRPDCLSYIGVAREIAALYNGNLRMPVVHRELRIPEDRVPYSIEIRDPDLCPRYVGLVMDRINVGSSPAWLQRRLEAAGMRPLNNVVDITNYVLLEFGHPLHAFDYRRLRGGKIVVARARPGQWMQTLDGTGRELDGEMLLINDAEGPVAIAGVMGGLNSEIEENTDTVLLECAYFRPSSVRRTSKKLGLSTEASYRFERGADWDDPVTATARAAQLIQEYAGGRIAGSVQDVYPATIAPVRIRLERARAEKLLGVALSDTFIENTLRSLNFSLAPLGPGAWEVTCPSFRADMELEADLIEELARFFGYQNIPTTTHPGAGAGVPSPVRAYEMAARHVLLGLGYCEAVNLSFWGPDEGFEFPSRDGEMLPVRNPLTEDTRFMRTNLAAGLVRSARRNFNHGNLEVRLFEIGKVYHRGQDGRPVERTALGVLGTGDFAGHNWHHPSGTYDYFHMKGVVTKLLKGMRSAPFEVVPAGDIPWLNPADASALLVAGCRVGVLGSIHPGLEEAYKLKQAVYLAEIDFRELSRHVFTPVRYEPLLRYPSVQRDLSITLPRSVAYGAVESGIRSLAIPELAGIELIDVYEGEKIPPERFGMTLRFTFVDRERTLTVDRVQAFGDNLLTFLGNQYGAILR